MYWHVERNAESERRTAMPGQDRIAERPAVCELRCARTNTPLAVLWGEVTWRLKPFGVCLRSLLRGNGPDLHHSLIVKATEEISARAGEAVGELLSCIRKA
jgi:hypothetical protein